jgi:hypothetical protein
MLNPSQILSKKMIPAKDDLLNILKSSSSEQQNDPQTKLIQSLINEIIRVKEVLRHSALIPNDTRHPGSMILNELVSEAYQSLVDYDTINMKKYYDLLVNCD